MKMPADCPQCGANMSAMELLEAARSRLNQATVRVAELEARNSDLVDIIWRLLQREDIAGVTPTLSSQQGNCK